MPGRPFRENILVLGQGSLANAVTAEMKKRRRYRIVELKESGRVLKDGLPFAGSIEWGVQAVPRTDRIVVAFSERRGRLPIEALLEAKRHGIVIEDAVNLYERLTGQLAIEQLQPSHLIFSKELGRGMLHMAVQRTMNVVLATIGLIVCAPLFIPITLLIKYDSQGPIFFVHERIGKDGRKFSLVKFRTMQTVDRSPSEWVRDNGDRITPIGRWLRKYRLDELPQLFNVLMGDMNLIGPRPHPASNYDLFSQCIPFYAFRTTVRPGITGWAQVRYGYANDLKEEIEKMRYDLYYIKHRSLRLDLEILVRTLSVILLGRESRESLRAEAETASNSGRKYDKQKDAA